MSAQGPTLGEVSATDGSWRFERGVDIRTDPYLLDHVVEGAPVFPAAYLVGLMTQAAHRMQPERQVLGVRDVRFVQAARFKDTRALQFSVTAEAAEANRVTVGISSSMAPPREGFPRIHRTHASGEVRMGERAESPARFRPLDFTGAESYEALYRLPREIQHGPTFLAGLRYRRPAQDQLLAVVAPPGHSKSGWQEDPRAPGWPAALLNAILHVAFSLGVLCRERTVLPLELASGELHAIPRGEVQVFARRTSAHDDLQTFHVVAWDEQGRRVALFRGFSVREVP
ncbi:polyketide synthase dehydratase domain-containing protein [Myxococcus faecalis]|uniref:polyketide synthase dehydratase domain-containing protein n=1 Tax=Myxococcus TaxID=32 RepID=UPI001CBB7BDF|nr:MULTISPECIES: polyketide synthase dehydratase domain-containing protein [unclassified Myxococcus]MBZ4401137.1 polyketide synthase dehydratase domain-containing protein [Myxococcus sp. AS-1-15]MBZ4410944.1 polyketide synthase dehydratase domain-containing protein [Myxococcus sp. XM-1-1-1]BDT32876.1 polyketide synthase dehydratase domain-containing protein [Myxococcus sp. MH1]